MNDTQNVPPDEPTPYRERQFRREKELEMAPGSMGAFLFYFVLILCVLISVYLRVAAPAAMHPSRGHHTVNTGL